MNAFPNAAIQLSCKEQLLREHPELVPELQQINNYQNGMSLRDYFAAKALQGLLAEGSTHIKDGWNEQTISHDAYYIADAMLAERDKNA